MANKVKEFVNEQAQMLSEQAKTLGAAPGKLVRGAAERSAKRLQALQESVQVVTRSGVKLTAISQSTAQNLIELQSEIVTAALADAVEQLERAAQTVSVVDMARNQAEVLKGARERIVNDLTQALTIIKDAGGEVRKVATETYTKVGKPASAAKSPRARKAKRTVRKTTVKAKAKAKTKSRRARRA